MPILKKPAKAAKTKEKDEVPMFHVGDKIIVEIDNVDVECEILSLDNEEKISEVQDDNGDKYDCTFDEMKPTGKKAGKKKPAEVEEETETPKKKSVKKADSLAGIFNKTKAASGGGGLPAGKHEAIVTALYLNETEKGLSGAAKFTLVNAGDDDGKSGVQFFQLLNAEGVQQMNDSEEVDSENIQQGFEYFKGLLVQLGMDEDAEIKSKTEFEEVLEELQEKELWVEINVRHKDGYVNIFLQSLMDNQEDKPETPSI